MHVKSSLVLVPVLALVAAGSVSAQQVATAPIERGYIAAQAGAISGPAAPVFAVEYGDNMHRRAQAYLTLSYFENLMRQTMRDDVTTLGTSLSALTGTPWELNGRDRGVTLTTGAKYLFGNGNTRPYVGAGAGIISLRRTVTEARIGDVTAAVFNDFSVGDADLSLSTKSLTRPLVEAGAGVGFLRGNTYFDIGYRYRRAFRLASTVDFSQLTAGIGYSF